MKKSFSTSRDYYTYEISKMFDEKKTALDIGGRIYELRKINGLTLEELGDKLGVQSSAVSKWEKGRVKNIPIEKLREMSIIFGCSTEYLITGETKEHRDVPEYVSGTSEVIDLYCKIPPEQRQSVLQYIRFIANQMNQE